MLRSVSSLRRKIGDCSLLLVGSIGPRLGEQNRDMELWDSLLDASLPELLMMGTVDKDPDISERVTATG
jgi:hypothetical protein